MFYGLLLSGALRAAVVLTAGLAATLLLSRAAAATRRFVLVLTLGAAIAVPIAAAVGPRWTVEAPAALSVLARESANEGAPGAGPAAEPTRVPPAASPGATVSPSPAGLGWRGAIALAWLVVATALVGRAAASHLRARAIARRATPVERGAWLDATKGAGAGRRVEIRASFELDSPAVAGLFRPTIVVPHGALDWPLERCRLVLVHELAHVRRRDVLVQALADMACALHWCNPLVWICARRLRVEREMAADDAVLAAGIRPSRYAEELVAVATSVATPGAALAMAERSSLEARVASILASRLARAPLAARGTVAVLGVGAAMAAAAACTSPVVSSPQHMTMPGVAPRAGSASDPAIQLAADAEIAVIEKEWSPELATIVVLDPATGEILANAGLNAGKPADVASTVAMAPGSTIKPIAIAAALELHAITVDQKFECGPAPRRYGDRELRDAHVSGMLDVAHLLAVSSNVGTSHIFDALGGDHLGQWLRRFHFGETPAVPGAATGAFPAHIETGSFEGAAVAIGGGLTATPLQMIAAYGAIAGDGVYHAPTLERGGSTGERLVSSETASSVMALLETVVVDETGTGTAARVDGVHVTGKTGTSQWTAPDGHDRTYASFVGVADLPSRRIVALVGIQASRDDMYSGNSAAPAFAGLVKRIRGS
ncbi:MAG TPA: penicillin-binding transpeptidase domain-containing protein [Polyangiaceae bacterium]